MYKKVIEQQKPEQKPESNNTIVKMLSIISGGGDIDAINNLIKTENIIINNRNILHEIIEKNDNLIDEFQKIELITFFLNNKVYIDHINNFKQTILHLACKSQYTNIVSLLLERKANLNVIDQYGKTPLHYAVIGSIIDCITKKDKKKEDIVPFNMEDHEYNEELKIIIENINTEIFENKNSVIKRYLDQITNMINKSTYRRNNTTNIESFKKDIINTISSTTDIKEKINEKLINKIIEYKKNIVNSLKDEFNYISQPYESKYVIPLLIGPLILKDQIKSNKYRIYNKLKNNPIIFPQCQKYINDNHLDNLFINDFIGKNVIDILNLFIKHQINILSNQIIKDILSTIPLLPITNFHFLKDTPFEIHYEGNEELYMKDDEIEKIQGMVKPHIPDQYVLSINYDSINNKSNQKCYNNDIELIDKLLKQPQIDLIINLKDDNKKTAIEYAIDKQQMNIIDLFIQIKKNILNMNNLIKYSIKLFEIHNKILFDNDIKNIKHDKLCNSYLTALIKNINEHDKYRNKYIKNINNIYPHFILLINKDLYEEIKGVGMPDYHKLFDPTSYTNCKTITMDYTPKYYTDLIDEHNNNNETLYTKDLIHLYNLNYIYYTIDEINTNKNINDYKEDFKIIKTLFDSIYNYIIKDYFEKNQSKIKGNDNLKKLIKICAILIKNYITTNMYNTIKKYLVKHIKTQNKIGNIKPNTIMNKILAEKIMGESLNDMLNDRNNIDLETQMIKIVRKIYDDDYDPDKKIDMEFIFNNIKNKFISNTIMPIKDDSIFINNLEEFIFPYYKNINYPTVINEMFNLCDSYIRYIVTDYKHVQIINILLN